MRRLIDPAKSKLVDEIQEAATPPKPPVSTSSIDPDESIDAVLKKGLYQIQVLMRCISEDIMTGKPHRNTVMNLKDCMTMLMDLKTHEQELLDDMSPEQLEGLLKDKE